MWHCQIVCDVPTQLFGCFGRKSMLMALAVAMLTAQAGLFGTHSSTYCQTISSHVQSTKQTVWQVSRRIQCCYKRLAEQHYSFVRKRIGHLAWSSKMRGTSLR